MPIPWRGAPCRPLSDLRCVRWSCRRGKRRTRRRRKRRRRSGGGVAGEKKVHKAGREEVKGKNKKREWDESCNLLCRSIYISFQSMRVLYMQSEHSAFNLFTM